MLQIQLIFPLRHPARFMWRDDPGFNASVHDELLDAHRRIIQSTAEAYPRSATETRLLRLRRRSMSQRQEMLLYYLLAQCVRARDLSKSTNFVQAFEWCTRAEQIAMNLLDFGAQVDLYELKGTLFRATSGYWLAAEEFSNALRRLREHSADMESFDPEFEVTLAAKTAAMEYAQGASIRALEHVQRAASLLPLTTMSLTGQGTITWTFALLYWQFNRLTEALEQVEMAVTLYRQTNARESTCRVLTLAADIALDFAESLDAQTQRAARDEQLARAASHIDEALRIGREADDAPGIALARLSDARLKRIQSHAEAASAEADIHAVLQQAQEIGDDSLLIAAQTALGIALIARGEKAHGKRWLNTAVKAAERISAPGLAHRAKRGLR
ncbi:MAG TPA: hypothetical protein VFN78_12685 [Ktedonobacterales bacterium]|nr:hypothetical protein [Ktedonobacterales bacterium]